MKFEYTIIVIFAIANIFLQAPGGALAAGSGASEAYFGAAREKAKAREAVARNNAGSAEASAKNGSSSGESLPNAAPLSADADETSAAAEKASSWGTETDYVSKYIWYGIPLSKGAIAQSYLWLEERGWTYMAYYNYDFSDREVNQINLYLSREFYIGRVGTELSANAYFYPHQDDSPMTTELSATFTLPLKGFNLYTMHAWDMKSYKGSYVGDIGVSFERSPRERTVVKGAAYVEYGSEAFNRVNLELDKKAFNVAGAELSLTYTRRDGYYLRPHVEFVSIIDRDLKEISEKVNTVSYGLTIGRTF